MNNLPDYIAARLAQVAIIIIFLMGMGSMIWELIL